MHFCSLKYAPLSSPPTTPISNSKLKLNNIMPRQANFRATYYKSLGVQGKEVEATFASLLGEAQPSISLVENLSQLIHMTLEFGVPMNYRPTMWCLVGGVLPLVRDVDADTWSFVRREKRVMFADVQMALRVHSSATDLPALVAFYMAHIRVHLADAMPLTWVMDDPQVTAGVMHAICQVLNDPMEQFWCAITFLELIDRGLADLRPVIDVAELYHISPLGLETIVFRICAAKPDAAKVENS
ncbi:hypothetical protein, variant [Saprolegnia diclina VS20]|uniref:Rab-GAP TBC domain-containing protein n=1 Tax=Saprolegnia diclina (strain VS20) TaxID=1156394 RepID=T0QRK4_SAPDV|nr:hypothetical protein, variant [Saprolegnia diclina VS20]EQC36560.1 hypothetical protein, variant [Saprolegnia diclina VS20]|eukprot:XP_008609980.1 hypothetical protein, variant [Saprolegnia diclina VS20]